MSGLDHGALAARILARSRMMSDHCLIGDDRIGQKIGAFRIMSWLGAGSLTVVYRGEHEATGRLAAINVARDEKSSAPRYVERAGKILSALKHPNIVRSLAVGRCRDATYLATEFISGPTLEQVLARRRALPWQEVVGLGLQICAALDEIHTHGVVHRNVKPAHLMMSEDGELKLIGFGLAISTDEPIGPPRAPARGTPGYMAPEQICSSSAVSHRLDLYALGVVLWQLLTGEKPYHELWESGHPRSLASLAFAHLTLAPTRPRDRIPQIPEALNELVIRLMAKTPQGRPKDIRQVARVLSRLPGIEDRRPGVPNRTVSRD
jgi:eukaryotic-like serine/threonine-protein kinase